MSGRISQCRACAAPFGAVFCDLGTMAVANSYLPATADLAAEQRFPLRAVVCSACRMVQLDHVVDAKGIFTDYAYFSSASSSWAAHAADFCASMTQRLNLGPASCVIEVASNDGYLLRNFVAAGIPCLGVEPAANVAAVAMAAGIPTEVAFLTEESALDIVQRFGPADLLVANNVLAHVPDINSFTAGLALLLAPTGILSVEVPHLLNLVDHVQFDTIYHEHYAYYSLLAIERLFARHDLHVFDVQQLPTHGGSLRIMAAKVLHAPSPALIAMRKTEALRGVDTDAFYNGFSLHVTQVIQGFQAWLAAKTDMGRKIAAYGAAAKGNTFLNAARVRRGDILAVADLSPAKQGRLLPGSHIPVVTPQELLNLRPDDILILPWNIAPEIVSQLRAAGHRSGIWTAVPEMRHL